MVLTLVASLMLVLVMREGLQHGFGESRWLVSLALLSVLFPPFFLPGVHERYFFAADVLSVVYAFYVPRKWVVPLLIQFASVFAYCAVFVWAGAGPTVVFGVRDAGGDGGGRRRPFRTHRHSRGGRKGRWRMKAQPLVSVVMINYNRERFVGAAIESVGGQTARDWELIVVENGSTDRSWEIIERWTAEDSRMRVIRLPSRLSIPVAANVGIKTLGANMSLVSIVTIASQADWECSWTGWNRVATNVSESAVRNVN